jgi:hypothetical protein
LIPEGYHRVALRKWGDPRVYVPFGVVFGDGDEWLESERQRFDEDSPELAMMPAAGAA